VSLWLVLGFLTLAAIAAVVWPLLRLRRAPGTDRGAFDRRIYRDQLAELARDVERGVIDRTQAAAAKLEIERRLLATEGGGPVGGDAAKATAPVASITVAMLSVAVAAGAVALYLAIGSPETRDEPFAARPIPQAEAAARARGDLAASVRALEGQLKDHPDDAHGWLLLARTQGALERWQDSAASYQHAMSLTKNAPEAVSGYGEMLVMAAGGIVTPAAHGAFATVLAVDPGNMPARYYLSLADAQAGKAQEAVNGWAKLVADAPPGAPWLTMLRQRIADTARDAGIAPPNLPVSTEAAPGSSAADVAAAGRMSPEDRQKMIRGMVENLAARLEKNPGDAAGWRRLANAYRVLGDNDKAVAAEARADAGGVNGDRLDEQGTAPRR
jgi:cytochrome c-type biogenesis protein CcmH